MEISAKGINLIKKWEGVRLEAYEDIIGVWTIGYGHTKDVKKGMTITQQQAEDFLKKDIKHHVAYMEQVIKVPLTQDQFDALASFHFNLGAEILKDSDLLIYINQQEWKKAAKEMERYVYAGKEKSQGLVNRRHDEVQLFLSVLENNTKTSTSESQATSTTSQEMTTSSSSSEQVSEEVASSSTNTSSPETSTSNSVESDSSAPSQANSEEALTPIDMIKKAYEKFFS
ncbi:lysozyme [Vagococcus zengguangii]|uniref:Lysozyme n=1 Tax=Vagococcus zengguangii TaxID=2571750 RepID=A0A4D7CU28_9ENTE|nr:lysozyme [Vagococcus zengguangii]QCI86783.1 lysozyme [Vagococcus zengguangii]TLG80389.1 lysozyme [Vagococcus zengguangii]